MPDLPLILCYSIVIVEMLVVNLYNIHKTCALKVPKSRYFPVLFGFSVLLFCIGLPLLVAINPHFGSGNGLFLLFGFLYLIPLRYLYKNPLSWIFEVMCTSYSYTVWVYAISANISQFFAQEMRVWVLLFIQSIIFALLSNWYAHFCSSMFVETLAHMPAGINHQLQLTSLLWLFVFLLTNFLFVSAASVLQVLCLLAMGILSFLCYNLLHTSLKSRMRAERFREIAYVDDLTNLPNRASFFQDGQKLILMQQPFDLIFLDLDHFKQINDTHGHLAGNEYLKGFAHSVQQLTKGLGVVYRMSGDEFVCILQEGARKEFAVRLVQYHWPIYVKSQPFLGVAAGSARYPQDGETLDALVQKADKAMYGNKKR